MRITEVEKVDEKVEKSPEEIKADQKAREAKRRAEEEQDRAEAKRIHDNSRKSVSPPLAADRKKTQPKPHDGMVQGAIDAVTGMYKRGKEQWDQPYDRDQAIDDALYSELGGVKTATGKDKLPPRTPPTLPKPKYRKAERFSKTVLNDPNSVLQFDVPGYRTGTVGKPGTIQEKWQQFKTQPVKEKAPPGDKYERMVKDIKKGYTKDGKLTDTERGIAYATAWKLYNKRKGKKS